MISDAVNPHHTVTLGDEVGQVEFQLVSIHQVDILLFIFGNSVNITCQMEMVFVCKQNFPQPFFV